MCDLKGNWKYRALTALIVIVVIGVLYILRSVTIPILIATMIAYLLDPVVDRLEKYGISRKGAILSLTLFAAMIIVVGMLLIVPAIDRELRSAAESLPRYLDAFKREVVPFLHDKLGEIFPQAALTVDELLGEGREAVSRIPLDVWNYALKTMAATFKGTLSLVISIIGFLIIPLYVYYILKDFDSFKEGIFSLIPPRSRTAVLEKLSEIDEVLSAFIRGQVMICIILAVLYSAGLFVIGIDLALVIGIFSGAAFIIPYVGTILGVSAASAMALLQFHDLRHVVYVFFLYGGVQVIEGFLITPRIIGEKVGLHPLAIILSIIIGGELFGFMGILLAVPAAASLKILAVGALQSYMESSYYRAGDT